MGKKFRKIEKEGEYDEDDNVSFQSLMSKRWDRHFCSISFSGNINCAIPFIGHAHGDQKVCCVEYFFEWDGHVCSYANETHVSELVKQGC